MAILGIKGKETMNDSYRISKNHGIYFSALGSNLQTRVTILHGEEFDEESRIILIEPGRTILMGDIDEELKALLADHGKPALNKMTATSDRPGGIFSTKAVRALTDHLYAGNSGTTAAGLAPRAKPTQRKSTPVYRDMQTA